MVCFSDFFGTGELKILCVLQAVWEDPQVSAAGRRRGYVFAEMGSCALSLDVYCRLNALKWSGTVAC